MIKILEGGKLSAPVPMKESRLGFTIHMGQCTATQQRRAPPRGPCTLWL